MTYRDLAALVTLAALWGGSFLLIRFAVPVFGPLSLMAGRVVIGGVLLWIGLRLTKRRPLALRANARHLRANARHLRANARHLLVLGAVNAAVPFTLVAASELHLSASLAAVLIATSPLFSALLGAKSGDERTTGHILYFYLIARIGPIRTNSVTYLTPLFGIVWGALFLGEPVTPGMLLGVGIILISVLLVNSDQLIRVAEWSRERGFARVQRAAGA